MYNNVQNLFGKDNRKKVNEKNVNLEIEEIKTREKFKLNKICRSQLGF